MLQCECGCNILQPKTGTNFCICDEWDEAWEKAGFWRRVWIVVPGITFTVGCGVVLWFFAWAILTQQ